MHLHLVFPCFYASACIALLHMLSATHHDVINIQAAASVWDQVPKGMAVITNHISIYGMKEPKMLLFVRIHNRNWKYKT